MALSTQPVKLKACVTHAGPFRICILGIKELESSDGDLRFLGLRVLNGRVLDRRPINLMLKSLKCCLPKLSLLLIPRVFPIIVFLLAPTPQNPARISVLH